MTEFFVTSFDAIDKNVGEGGIFLIAFSLLTVAFLFALLSSIFVSEYVFYKRVWYIFALFGISGAQLSVHVLCVNEAVYALLTFSVGLIYAIPIFTIKPKKFCTEKQLKFAKFIDTKVEKEKASNESFVREKMPKEEFDAFNPPPPTTVKFSALADKQNTCDIDFSHVKNVISRLEYFSLGPSDKRQVRELEACVYAVENGEYTLEMKNKINEGLGALLKIMSKYGV